MRLDIAEDLTKPLGHLCVETGSKPTEYMNAAVRTALVMDGEIPCAGYPDNREVIPSIADLRFAIGVSDSPEVKSLPNRERYRLRVLTTFVGRFVAQADHDIPDDLPAAPDLPALPPEDCPGSGASRRFTSLERIQGYLRSPGFATGSSDPAAQGAWLADEIASAVKEIDLGATEPLALGEAGAALVKDGEILLGATGKASDGDEGTSS